MVKKNQENIKNPAKGSTAKSQKIKNSPNLNFFFVKTRFFLQ